MNSKQIILFEFSICFVCAVYRRSPGNIERSHNRHEISNLKSDTITIDPKRFQNATMPKNITVKNIPDSLVRKIEASSNKNRRSINSEIIFQLEQKLNPPRQKIPTLKQIDSLRAKTKAHYLTESELEDFKNEGRA